MPKEEVVVPTNVSLIAYVPWHLLHTENVAATLIEIQEAKFQAVWAVLEVCFSIEDLIDLVIAEEALVEFKLDENGNA